MKFRFLFWLVMILAWRAPQMLAQEIRAPKEETITVQEYCTFLNENQEVGPKTLDWEEAITPNDFYESGDWRLHDEARGTQILFSGKPTNRHYEVICQPDDSMHFISWNDAAHYSDWLNDSGNSSSSLQPLVSSLSCTSTIDHALKSNFLTFRFVSTEATTHQAMIEEATVPSELADSEFCLEGLALLFSLFGPTGTRNPSLENRSFNEERNAGALLSNQGDGLLSLQERSLSARTTEMNVTLGMRINDPQEAIPLLTTPHEEREGNDVFGHSITHETLSGARKPRGITFDSAAIANKEFKQNSLKSHTIKVPETAETKNLRSSHAKEFKGIIEDIEEKILALPEETPQEVAAIYAAAYPEVKQQLQEFILTLEGNPELQNRKSAKLLYRKTVEFLKMVPKTCDLTAVSPILIAHPIEHFREDLIPMRRISYIAGELASLADKESEVAIRAADHLISNLKAFFKVIPKDDLPVDREAFLNALEDQADKENLLAYEKYSIACSHLHLITDMKSFSDDQNHAAKLEKAQSEVTKAENHLDQSRQAAKAALELKSHDLDPDNKKLESIAVTQLIRHAKEALQIAEEFKTRLQSLTQAIDGSR